jgi:uncharacterized protein (UPF0332 family)
MPIVSDDDKKRITDYLGLAMGLMLSVQVTSTSSEYQIRNSYSRLYYAFFHVGLALLLSQGENIDRFRHDHGRVHEAIGRRLGKYVGRFVRDLYKSRLEADYEPRMFVMHYGNNLENARSAGVLILERAKQNFYWIYQEARKNL